MKVNFSRLVLLLLLTMSAFVGATDVVVKGLFAGQAVLVVDGKQKLLKQGQVYRGVELIAADSNEALVVIDGEPRSLKVSTRIANSYRAAKKHEVRLLQSGGGHYVTPARINNRPVTVMVDTGATVVAMNLPQAKALGLDYKSGAKVKVSTANGVANSYQILLPSVTVGTVKVNNVDAIVSEGEFPEVILLGNSYLSRIDMSVDQGVMVLQSRQ